MAALAPARLSERERWLWAALILAAGLVRCIGLSRPLDLAEAETSWAAWVLATGGDPEGLGLRPKSALFLSFQWMLFLFGGEGEVLARLPASVIGAATPLAAGLWRPALGRWSTLLLAAWLAFDPWLVAAGRRADATTLALGLTLVAAGLVASARRARLAAACLGLLSACGPVGCALLVPLAIGARRLFSDRRNLWIAVFACLLGTTAGLTQRFGLAVLSFGITAALDLAPLRAHAAAWIETLPGRLLLALALGAAAFLAARRDARPPWRSAAFLTATVVLLGAAAIERAATSPDPNGLHRLAMDLSRLGQGGGNRGDQPIEAVAEPQPDPRIGWHLRHEVEQQRVRWVLAPSGAAPGVLTPWPAEAPPGRSWAHTRYGTPDDPHTGWALWVPNS